MATLFLFKIRQNKTLLEGKRYKNTTLSYNEKIGGILQLLGGNSEDLHWGNFIPGHSRSCQNGNFLLFLVCNCLFHNIMLGSPVVRCRWPHLLYLQYT